MKKKIKIAIGIFIAILLIGYLGYNYVMHGGARNLEKEEAAFVVTASQISSEFTTDINKANAKYLEKAVAIQGKVTDISENQLIIDNNVICALKEIDNSVKLNQTITVKGRVVGYDDLMGELKLDQCFINKN